MAAFLADPPEWFVKQAAACLREGSPERLVKPLISTTAYKVFGTADRHEKAGPHVREYLKRVGA